MQSRWRSSTSYSGTRLLPIPIPLYEAFPGRACESAYPRTRASPNRSSVSRQETRVEDRKLDTSLPPFRSNVALRQTVHFQGELRVAFDRGTCAAGLAETLRRAAPVINYLGKRGSFVQYLESTELSVLDESFTRPVHEDPGSAWGHRASLDDFGPGATFDALNSYSATNMKRGVHRKFVDTLVPLGVRNLGPGFWHYSRERSDRL